MEIRDSFGDFLPNLGLHRTRDALAKMVELKWPYSRRKAVMKEWDLNDEEARSVCAGLASWATFDKIISHKRGGWSVLFPIFGALLDQTAEQFIIRERAAHAEHAARLGALVGDWWPLGADRPADAPDVLSPRHQRRGSGSNRKAQG